MKPIVIHSRTVIQWGKWDWFFAASPPLNSRTIYYLFSLCRQPLMKVWEKGVDGVSALSQWQLFISCGTVACNFNVIHPQRRNTKGWGCSNSFFTASIWQANSHVGCSKNHVLTFSSRRTRDWKLAFFVSRPHQYFGIHYSGIFSKATSGNSCDCALWHTQNVLGWVSLRQGKVDLKDYHLRPPWWALPGLRRVSLSLSVPVDHHRRETGLKGNVTRENISQNIFVASWWSKHLPSWSVPEQDDESLPAPQVG